MEFASKVGSFCTQCEATPFPKPQGPSSRVSVATFRIFMLMLIRKPLAVDGLLAEIIECICYVSITFYFSLSIIHAVRHTIFPESYEAPRMGPHALGCMVWKPTELGPNGTILISFLGNMLRHRTWPSRGRTKRNSVKSKEISGRPPASSQFERNCVAWNIRSRKASFYEKNGVVSHRYTTWSIFPLRMGGGIARDS